MSEAAELCVTDAAADTGRELADARRQSGLSVADVARQLKLSPWQVEAMENGNHARLPGTVFVRGFIRNYARLVKLDPAPLLQGAAYDANRDVVNAPAVTRPANIPFPHRAPVRWSRYAVATAALVAAVLVIEYFADFSNMESQLTVSSQPAVLKDPVGGGGTADGPAPPQLVSLSTGEHPAGASVNAVMDAAVAPAAPAAAPAPARGPGERILRLAFERDAWVEVKDRSGRKILSQLNAAGSSHTVSGHPPFSLIVGNAAGVRILYDDQPVDLAPHIKVDVARLTLE